ncbi:hypothetical protein V8E36_005531 [Tilletia maclaganii]
MLKGRLPRQNISRAHHTMQSLLSWIFLFVLCPSFSLTGHHRKRKGTENTGKIRNKKTHRGDANVHYVATGAASA